MVTKKLLAAGIYIIFIVLFDSISYGIVYQHKIKKENYNHPVWEWVFKESVIPASSGNGHIDVPRYRFIQKTLEISGIMLIFFYFGFAPAAGLIISHWLLTYDLLYYLFLNHLHTLTVLDNTYKAYWLTNWYQAGYFFLQPFNHEYFIICGVLGIAAAVAGCLVSFK